MFPARANAVAGSGADSMSMGEPRTSVGKHRGRRADARGGRSRICLGIRCRTIRAAVIASVQKGHSVLLLRLRTPAWLAIGSPEDDAAETARE